METHLIPICLHLCTFRVPTGYPLAGAVFLVALLLPPVGGLFEHAGKGVAHGCPAKAILVAARGTRPKAGSYF